MRIERRHRWMTGLAVVAGLAVAAGITFALLRGLGYDRADQLAGVVSMTLGLLSFAAAVAAIVQARSGGGRRQVRLRTAWRRQRIPAELRGFLAGTYTAANRSPGPLLGPRRVSLDSVYVRQRVEQTREPDRATTPGAFEDDRLFLPPDRRPRVLPVRRQLRTVLKKDTHLFVEGGPGSGKSMMAGQLCRELAGAWLGRPGPPLTDDPVLPLLTTARDLDVHSGLAAGEVLAQAANRRLGMHSAVRLDPSLLTSTVNGVPWLVVIDGLDEIPPADREALVDMLARWTLDAASPYRFVITSRPIAAGVKSVLGTASMGHYTLVPFDATALRDFAGRWFGDAGADSAARFVQEVGAGGLRDMVAVPLMATIAIRVFEQHPGRALPRNRHDLYEQFIAWLHDGGTDRRTTGHTQLARHSPALADGLYDHLDGLVERLAAVRVGSREPLLPAAESWLREQGLLTGPAPARLRDQLVEALVSTGLLTRDRGPDLDFIHQTIAEHFAARTAARDLPADFDPGHPVWQRWIHRAVAGDPVGEAVLSRWTRDHTVEPLFTSLFAAGEDGRMLTARLIAEGAAAGRFVPDCLTAVERSIWRDHRYRLPELFGLVRRLPAGPEVITWLRSLIDRADGYGSVLVAAARVRADLDDGGRDQALAAIRRVLRGDGPAEHRCDAAKALCELDPGAVTEAAGVLRQLLQAPGTSATDLIRAATELADLDEAGNLDAIGALERIMRDHAAELRDRQAAAEATVELDDDRRPAATASLRALLHAPHAETDHLIDLAVSLSACDARHTDEAADILHGILTDPLQDGYLRVSAGRSLALMETRYTADVSSWLKAVGGDALAYPTTRVRAYVECYELGDDHRAGVPHLMAQLIAGRTTSPETVRYANTLIMQLDLAAQEVFADAFHAMLEDTAIWAHGQQMLALGVGSLRPESAEDVRSHLEALCRQAADTYELAIIAGLLPMTDTRLRERMVKTLTAAVFDPDTYDYGLEECISKLLEIAPDRHEEVTAQVTEALTAHAGGGQGRALALRMLTLGPDQREAGLDALAQEMARIRTDAPERNSLARSAGFDAPELALRFAEIFATQIADRHTPDSGRIDLAGHLIRLDPNSHDAARAMLLDIMDDTGVSQADRGDAAWIVATRFPDASRDASRVLADIGKDSCASAAERIRATARLARIHASAADACADTLLRVLRDPTTGTSDLRDAAAACLAIRRDRRQAVVTALLTRIDDGFDVVTDPDFLATLAALDPEPAVVTRAAVIGIGAGDLPGWHRHRFGAFLGRTTGLVAATEAALQHGLRGHQLDLGQVLAEARTLLAVAPHRQRLVTRALWRITGDPSATGADLQAAFTLLLELQSPHTRSRAREELVRIFDGRDGTGLLLLGPIDAGELLVDARDPTPGRVFDRLRAMLDDPAEPPAVRRRVNWALYRHAGLRRRAADRLCQQINGPDAGDVVALIELLEAFDANRTGDVVDVARTVLDTAGPHQRIGLTRIVLRYRPDDAGAVDRLVAIGADRRLPAALRSSAVDALLTDDPVHYEAGIALVERLLRAEALSTADEIWLAERLAGRGNRYRPEGVARLRCIAEDPDLPAAVRLRSATALIGIEVPAASPGLAVLRDMLDLPEVPAFLRIRAARALLDRPGPARSEARDFLRRVADDPARPLHERLDAAAAVDWSTDPGGCLLTRLLAAPDARPVEVFRAVAPADEPRRPGARKALGGALERMIAAPDTHPWLRCWALRERAKLDRAGFERCTGELRRLLADPATDPDHRRWAAQALADAAPALTRMVRDELVRFRDACGDARLRRRVDRSIGHVAG